MTNCNLWDLTPYSFLIFLIFFIDIFVSLAIPSLQLRLTTSLFSNLDSQLYYYYSPELFVLIVLQSYH
jgi:hypothetical protein